MHPAVPIAFVFIGCCTNVVFLELLIREDPGAGNMITFTQFLFIAIEGFFTTTRCATRAPCIPMRKYLTLVILFFVTSVMNNYALKFNISMPLHMIFRSGSLIANLVLGIIILKRAYPVGKYLSVILITLGIVICTFASSSNTANSSSSPKTDSESSEEYLTWSIGIALLTGALFLSARMGIYQETLYKVHGKHPKEALFYLHALPLPGFLLLAKDLYSHSLMYCYSESISVPLLSIAIPKMWLYIFGNMVTQYVCIRSVFILTTECTSLTVTLIVTLRKFLSLLFSIFYFKNPFNLAHWAGTALVFGGTLMFADVPTTIRDLLAAAPITDAKKKK